MGSYIWYTCYLDIFVIIKLKNTLQFIVDDYDIG